MDLVPYKIKLRRNRNTDNGLHQYALTYQRGNGHINQAGYDILSALTGDSDLIIELNTDLLYGVSPEPDKCAEKFLEDIRNLNLAHSSRTAPSKYPVRFLGFTLERRDKKQSYEIAAYVPNKVWKNASFRDVLPVCGARYYITREPMDAQTTVDNLPALSEEQKAAMFRWILFHVNEYARFGILSAADSEKELRGLLGLR